MDEKELQFQKEWYIDDIRDELLPGLTGGAYARIGKNATEPENAYGEKNAEPENVYGEKGAAQGSAYGEADADPEAGAYGAINEADAYAARATDGARAVTAIYRRYARNAGDNYKDVLSDEGLRLFVGLTRQVAKAIPDKSDIESARVPEYFKRFLLRLRGDEKSAAEADSAKPDVPITANIRSIMLYKETLFIEGYFDMDRFGELMTDYAVDVDSEAYDADGAYYSDDLDGTDSAPAASGSAAADSAHASKGHDPNAAESAPAIATSQSGKNQTSPSPDEQEMFIIVGKYKVNLPDAGHFAERRHFGKVLVSFRTFEARVNISELIAGTEIYFAPAEACRNADTSGADANTGASPKPEKRHSQTPAEVPTQTQVPPNSRCRLVFAEPQSGLCPQLGVLYKKYKGFGLEYDAAKQAVRVVQPSVSLRLRNELDAISGLMHAKLPNKRKLAELCLRMAYWITKPYYSRLKLRLYFDKIYMGGDNGQTLFEHSSDVGERTGGSKNSHRYLAMPDSRVFRELKEKGYKVQSYTSPMRKLLALHAKIILATHSGVMGFAGLNSFERRWFADLWNARVVCIQHGLTMQYIPQYQARYIDNTEFYCCAAPAEAEQLKKQVYAYEPSMIKLTGLPRYDELVSNAERLILLSPTWRRSLAIDGNRIGTAKEYNPAFADTLYYSVYRRVVTNDAIISLLARTGYRLRFLLHPTLSSQIGDFADCENEHIEIISSAAEGYARHLRRAAVLITDYSGIQYDWAYMEKPLIYFHHEELPPTYDNGVFNYEKQGFGPVARTLGELEIYLEAAIIGGAGIGGGAGAGLTPTSLYRERMKDFFAWRDRENCARIYEELDREYG